MTCKTVRVDVSPPLQVVQVSPPRGYSAYEVALQQGFVGTKSQWLDSLVPKPDKLIDDFFAALAQELYDNYLPDEGKL